MRRIEARGRCVCFPLSAFRFPLFPCRTTGVGPGPQICVEGLYYLVFFAIVFFVALVGEVNLLVMLAGAFIGPLWFSWRLVAATLRGLETPSPRAAERLRRRLAAG